MQKWNGQSKSHVLANSESIMHRLSICTFKIVIDPLLSKLHVCLWEADEVSVRCGDTDVHFHGNEVNQNGG